MKPVKRPTWELDWIQNTSSPEVEAPRPSLKSKLKQWTRQLPLAGQVIRVFK